MASGPIETEMQKNHPEEWPKCSFVWLPYLGSKQGPADQWFPTGFIRTATGLYQLIDYTGILLKGGLVEFLRFSGLVRCLLPDKSEFPCGAGNRPIPRQGLTLFCGRCSSVRVLTVHPASVLSTDHATPSARLRRYPALLRSISLSFRNVSASRRTRLRCTRV